MTYINIIRKLSVLVLLAGLLYFSVILTGCSSTVKLDHFEHFDGIPDEVSKAAAEYVQTEFNRFSAGISQDSGYQLLDWRVEKLVHTCTYDDFEGLKLDIYCFDYKFQADWIENVLLAGGMYSVEDGWFCPGYDSSSYLIFQDNKYLCFVGINDGAPQESEEFCLFNLELASQLYQLGLINIDYFTRYYQSQIETYKNDIERYETANAALLSQLKSLTEEQENLKQTIVALMKRISEIETSSND